MARPRNDRPRGSIHPIKGSNGTRWMVRVTLGPETVQPRRRVGQTETATVLVRPRLSHVVRGTKKDAHQWLTEQLTKYDTGLMSQVPRKLTLGAWLEEYRTIYRQDVGPRSRYDTDVHIRTYLKSTPVLQHGRLLSDLTPPEVQAWVGSLVQRGLGPRTVRMAYGVLRHALGQAVVLGYVPRNVATIGIKLPKMERRKPRSFTWEEAQRFLDAARADRWYPLFLLLLTAGLRPGEAFALKWDDLEGDLLRVRRSLVRLPKQRYMLKSTKTDRARTVPLPAMTLVALEEFKQSLSESQQLPDALMFANAEGEPLDHGNLANRHYKPILARAKLPHRRLYDLRHSCATLLLQDGEHVKVVAERLGHADVTLTLNTYTDVLQGMQEKAASRFDDRLKAVRKLKLA